MLDIDIGLLRLNVENAAGHEGRLPAITTRAIALLAERLDRRAAAAAPTPGRQPIGELAVTPVSLNLGRMSDEQAAQALAGALLESLAVRLHV